MLVWDVNVGRKEVLMLIAIAKGFVYVVDKCARCVSCRAIPSSVSKLKQQLHVCAVRWWSSRV